jgi:hypothetical protein
MCQQALRFTPTIGMSAFRLKQLCFWMMLQQRGQVGQGFNIQRSVNNSSQSKHRLAHLAGVRQAAKRSGQAASAWHLQGTAD